MHKLKQNTTNKQERDNFSLIAIIIFFILLQLLSSSREFLQTTAKNIESLAYSKMQSKISSINLRKGKMISLKTAAVMTQLELSKENQSLGAGARWLKRNESLIGYSGMYADKNDYFANSYFTGFKPFHVNNPWIAFYALVDYARYADDKRLFGFDDMWQLGNETLYRKYGDCEDLSILLTDWLTSSGFDARVVSGKHKWYGHAWVVLKKDNQHYLLDPTGGRQFLRRKIPYPSLFNFHFPSLMFDRDFIWEKTNPDSQSDYSDKSWEKTARFVEGV